MRKIQQSEGGKRHGPYRLGGNLAVDQLLHLPEILRRFHPQIGARIDGSPLGHGDDRLVFTKVVANPPRAIHRSEERRVGKGWSDWRWTGGSRRSRSKSETATSKSW